MVLEGSHKRMDLLENYVYRDVDSYCENRERDLEKVKKNEWTFSGTLSHNPVAIRNKFEGRWLVTEFEPGDFLTFNMFAVHASIDNQTENETRISTDSRYQRASEPIDERWVGVNPPAHGPDGKRGLIC
jgi:ectoine hydroxylase-related dioxygenase (phytanoyl-CoA dioxygenase family)